jgi:hypothetical protein
LKDEHESCIVDSIGTKDIISHTFPVRDISQALQLASTGESGKVLLDADVT